MGIACLFQFTLSVYSGCVGPFISVKGEEASGIKPISSVLHQRYIMGPNCRRIPVKHGKVRGVLYLPEGKLSIVMGKKGK